MKYHVKRLGSWKQINPSGLKKLKISEFSLQKIPYKKNNKVSYKGKYYKAMGLVNQSFPGDSYSRKINFFFEDPEYRMLTILIFAFLLLSWEMYRKFFRTKGEFMQMMMLA